MLEISEHEIRDRIDNCLGPVCVVGQGVNNFPKWVLDVKTTVERILTERRQLMESSNSNRTSELEFEEIVSNELTRLVSTLQQLSPQTDEISKKFYDDFMACFRLNTQEIPVEMSSFDLREYDPRLSWFRKIADFAGSCIGRRNS